MKTILHECRPKAITNISCLLSASLLKSCTQVLLEEVPKVFLSNALTWPFSYILKSKHICTLRGQQIEWQAANPFCKSLKTLKARLHEGMQSCQPIREHQFGFANLEKNHTEKMREQSMQQAPFGY